MATGEVRGAFSMSEPGLGSGRGGDPVQGGPRRRSDTGTINGQKMWLTNGGSSNLVAVLVRTDLVEKSVYKNMTTFLIEKESGFGETAQGVTVPGKIEKMGYKGVDTTELVFTGHHHDHRSSAAVPGKGFYQMMDGVEVGRSTSPPGRAAMRAFELGIAYSPAARDLRQEDRRAPGHPSSGSPTWRPRSSQPPDDGQGRA